jgi:hypothetical protein
MARKVFALCFLHTQEALSLEREKRLKKHVKNE